MLAPAGTFIVRPVRESDEAGIGRLLAELDPDSRYLRWFSYAVDVRGASRWAAHPEIDAALGFVAVADEEIIGHGVMIPLSGESGEVAFEVAAPWRRHGVATALLDAIIASALLGGTRQLTADVLTGNADMLAVFREHGLHTEIREGGVVSLTVPLAAEQDGRPTSFGRAHGTG
ncbi:MAG: GNAT family N-acetyltransferase [Solirubrobacteraceae bacterium]|nr:GNAT family N-acetyltransferase [Solirubrobacteraceae bacterium]